MISRRSAAILGVAVLLVLVVVAYRLADAGRASRRPPSGPALLGVFESNDAAGALGDVRALESWQGKRFAVVNLFTSWVEARGDGPLFRTHLPALWRNRNVPMISLWADLPNAAVAAGEFDGELDAFAVRLGRFLAGPDGRLGTGDDRRAYLRLAYEANGSWSPYSPAHGEPPDPAVVQQGVGDFVAMWHRVHDRFVAAGLGRAQLAWMYSVSTEDSCWGDRCYPLTEGMYPGDAYVDWVGIDGYATPSPSGSLKPPGQVFGPMIRRVRAITGRPIGVSEVGVGIDAADAAAKSRWVASYFDWLAHSGMRMSAWFNFDKEHDWAIFGGGGGDTTYRHRGRRFRGYAAYRTGAARPWVIGSGGGRRLLTDAEFLGRN